MSTPWIGSGGREQFRALPREDRGALLAFVDRL